MGLVSGISSTIQNTITGADSPNLKYLTDKAKAPSSNADVVKAIVTGSDLVGQKLERLINQTVSMTSLLTSINKGIVTQGKISGKVKISATKNSITVLSTIASILANDKQTEKTAASFHAFVLDIDKLAKHNDTKIVGVLNGIATAMGSITQSVPSFKQMAGVAAGLALVGLALITVVEVVTVEQLAMFAGIIGVIAVASYIAKDAKWGLVQLAMGVAVLGLSLWGFSEVVTWGGIAKYTASMAVLIGAQVILNKFGGSNLKESAISTAIIAGSMILVAAGFLEFNYVDWQSIAKGGVAMAGVVGMAAILQKISINREDAVNLAILGASVGVIGLGFMTFNNVPITSVLTGLAGMLGVIGIGVLLTKAKVDLMKSALGLGAMGIAIGVMGIGFSMMPDLSAGMVGTMLLAMGGSAAIFAAAGLGPVPAFIMAGALAMGAVGLGVMALSGGFLMMKQVNLTPDDVNRFTYAVGSVRDVFVSIGNPLYLIPLAIGTANAVMIGVSTILLAAALGLVSKIPMPDQKAIDAFKYGVTGVTDVLVGVGLVAALKLAVIAPIMVLVGVSVMLIGTAISLFTKLSTDPASVQLAIATLGTFTDGVVAVMSRYEGDTLGKISRGAMAISNVANVLSDIARAVTSIGNMEFIEHTVVNGRLVVKSVRKVTPQDFANVGTAIGNVLNAITEPLIKIADAKEDFTIGGIKVTNPFGNKVATGIEKLQGLGSVFDPITRLVSTFSSKNINAKFVTDFNTNIANIVNGIATAITTAKIPEDFDDKVANVYQIVGITNGITRTMMNGGPRLAIGAKAISSIAFNTTILKNNINGMKLDALTKTTDLFNAIARASNSANIKELTEAMSKLANALESAMSATGGGGAGAEAVSEKIKEVPHIATRVPVKRGDYVNKTNPDSLAETFITKSDEIKASINALSAMLVSGTGKIKVVNDGR